jgi:hypothetical protein
MTGHTGYITHARKILKSQQQPAPEKPMETEEKQETADETAESA